MPNYKGLKQLLENLLNETQAVGAQRAKNASLTHFCKSVSRFSELDVVCMVVCMFIRVRGHIRRSLKEIKVTLQQFLALWKLNLCSIESENNYLFF